MKIGLTQRILTHNGQAYDSTQHGWYQYFKNHTLVPIANRTDQDFDKLARELDCLVITGGDDTPLRRVVELKISTQMMKRQRPILGVCHGAFLLTDILGGKVIGVEGHHNTEHWISYFGEMISVNSFHALAIEQAPESATILCVDQDNHCEAWIDNTVAAVVWHPERMMNPWLPDEIEDLLTRTV